MAHTENYMGGGTPLRYFHPFDVTFMDLGIHVLAVSIVVGAASAIEARRSQRSILTRHV